MDPVKSGVNSTFNQFYLEEKNISNPRILEKIESSLKNIIKSKGESKLYFGSDGVVHSDNKPAALRAVVGMTSGAMGAGEYQIENLLTFASSLNSVAKDRMPFRDAKTIHKDLGKCIKVLGKLKEMQYAEKSTNQEVIDKTIKLLQTAEREIGETIKGFEKASITDLAKDVGLLTEGLDQKTALQRAKKEIKAWGIFDSKEPTFKHSSEASLENPGEAQEANWLDDFTLLLSETGLKSDKKEDVLSSILCAKLGIGSDGKINDQQVGTLLNKLAEIKNSRLASKDKDERFINACQEIPIVKTALGLVNEAIQPSSQDNEWIIPTSKGWQVLESTTTNATAAASQAITASATFLHATLTTAAYAINLFPSFISAPVKENAFSNANLLLADVIPKSPDLGFPDLIQPKVANENKGSNPPPPPAGGPPPPVGGPPNLNQPKAASKKEKVKAQEDRVANQPPSEQDLQKLKGDLKPTIPNEERVIPKANENPPGSLLGDIERGLKLRRVNKEQVNLEKAKALREKEDQAGVLNADVLKRRFDAMRPALEDKNNSEEEEWSEEEDKSV